MIQRILRVVRLDPCLASGRGGRNVRVGRIETDAPGPGSGVASIREFVVPD